MSCRCVINESFPPELLPDDRLGFQLDVMDDTLSCLKFLAAHWGTSVEYVIASIVVNQAEFITNSIYGEKGLSGNSN